MLVTTMRFMKFILSIIPLTTVTCVFVVRVNADHFNNNTNYNIVDTNHMCDNTSNILNKKANTSNQCCKTLYSKQKLQHQ